MSRTKRFVPYWARYPGAYESTRIGLGGYSPRTGEDPRNRFERGYDRHSSMSNIYTRYSGRCDRDNYKGIARKFFKRAYHKDRRRQDKAMIQRSMKELDDERLPECIGKCHCTECRE